MLPKPGLQPANLIDASNGSISELTKLGVDFWCGGFYILRMDLASG
jgi:hypothetical protein